MSLSTLVVQRHLIKCSAVAITYVEGPVKDINVNSSLKGTGRKMTADVTETFEVSADGKTLTTNTNIVDGVSRRTSQSYDPGPRDWTTLWRA